MNPSKIFIAIGMSLIVSSMSSRGEEKTPPLSVAVLDFKDGSEDLAGTGASVAALLQAKLGADSPSPLVERAELKEVLSEQELTLSEAVGAGQAAKVGQLVGAEVLVSGRVFGAGDRVFVVAKAISSSTGRVIGVTADYERSGKPDAAVASLSLQLAKVLKEKQVELAGGKSLEERKLEEVKDLMKGRKGPSVRVAITETVLRSPAPDPAVSTELCRALEAAGWKVVSSDPDADVIVTGEAFAETGVRRGNLWVSRARLEFTVKNKDGKVLKTDRVVVANVDIAEATGNKGALQKAGVLAAPEVVAAWIAPKRP